MGNVSEFTMRCDESGGKRFCVVFFILFLGSLFSFQKSIRLTEKLVVFSLCLNWLLVT